MCGIMGYYAFDKDKPTIKEVSNILVELEVRGKDSTGFAFFDPKGKVQSHKKAVKATDYVETSVFKNLEGKMPAIFIGHTRYQTKGTFKDNVNNHPITCVDGLAVVHNGMINNDDDLFNKFKLNRKGEVDSEIIARLIEKEKFNYLKAVKLMGEEMSGSAAIAAISEKNPGKLLLARSNNPIDLMFDLERKIVFFSSTQESLKNTVKSKKVLYGFIFEDEDYKKRFKFFEVNKDSALVLGENGVELTSVFNLPSYRRTYSTYDPDDYEDYSGWSGVKSWGDAWDRLNNGFKPKGPCDVCGKEKVARYIFGQQEYICKRCYIRRAAVTFGVDRGNNNLIGMHSVKCQRCEKWFDKQDTMEFRSEKLCVKCVDWKVENECGLCLKPLKDKEHSFQIKNEWVCEQCTFGDRTIQ